jgi:hypothetical protein
MRISAQKIIGKWVLLIRGMGKFLPWPEPGTLLLA